MGFNKKLELLLSYKFEIKIADFGFSKKLINREDHMNTYCGTPINMAPELLLKAPYNYKVDVWSIGIILY